MTGLLTFLKGSVRVELNCRYAERAINLCARNHVDFTDLRRTPEGAVRMTVGIGGYAALRRISRETGAFTVKTVRREGAPFLLWRIRRRYALLAGLALCAAAIADDLGVGVRLLFAGCAVVLTVFLVLRRDPLPAPAEDGGEPA